jgi:hypothetical protein
MNRRDLSILLLLVVVITAPIVDALACDDCKDSIPLRDMRKCSTNGLHQSDDSILSSDACCPAQQETGTSQDLCPLCSQSLTVMTSLVSGAPATISHTYHLPKLFALSNLSKSITKPPQN